MLRDAVSSINRYSWILCSVIQKQAEDDKITHQELFIVLPAVVTTKWRGLAVARGGKYLKHIRFNNILWLHQRLPKNARRGARQQMQLVMLWNIWFYFKHCFYIRHCYLQIIVFGYRCHISWAKTGNTTKMLFIHSFIHAFVS